ncbi:MAG: hypothetical protein AAFY65_16290 [Pseudomonadota bacterium]
MTASAKDIYQAFLDETSRLVWNAEFDTLTRTMTYPHVIATKERDVTVEDGPALTVLATAFRANIGTLGATAYHRICRSASFRVGDANWIDGTHETYVLRGATTILEPFTGVMSLRHDGTRWLGAGIRSDVRNADICMNAPEILTTRSFT